MIILLLLLVIDLFMIGLHYSIIHPPAELGMSPAALSARTTKAIYSAVGLVALNAGIVYYIFRLASQCD